jgi:hypothetical protein
MQSHVAYANREWYDLCRLKVGSRHWNTIEIYACRGKGPNGSDYPVRKQSASDFVKRASEFLDTDHELPAAANYARRAFEWALKEICATKHLPVAYNVEPNKYDTDDFLQALVGKGNRRKRKKAIKKSLQTEIEALRKTVLNPFSHSGPTTAVESEIRRAIAVADQLVALAKAG